MGKFYIYTIVGSIIISVLLSLSSSAQPIGANMSNPLNAGTFPGNPYSYTKNNSPANGYLNDIGNPSTDIYYKITITRAGLVRASHCSSTFDTYMFLLNSQGVIVASNDDGNYCSGYFQAAINEQVEPGVYYIVSEGWNGP